MIERMTYRGRMEHGVVVFDGPEKPAEGTIVNIEPTEAAADGQARQRLLKWAGAIEGLPADSSVNLDHYLYGQAKK